MIASQSLELHAFEDSAPLARRLAEQLGIGWRPIEVHRFPDEESLVRVRSEGAPEAIVLRTLDRPNPKLPELLFAADALRRRGVGRIVLVAPYLGYMRQDRVFQEGEAVSQQVVAPCETPGSHESSRPIRSRIPATRSVSPDRSRRIS